jgi:hypothetical protein
MVQAGPKWPEAPPLLEIRALPGFVLRGRFADGSILDWDIRQYIEESTGELIKPLKDFSYFSQVSLEGSGLIHWPNGLDLDADELYSSGTPTQTPESDND